MLFSRSPKTKPIEFTSKANIPRFDEDKLLPAEENSQKLKPFKWITSIRRPLAWPSYFPVRFNIYTRQGNIENVEFGARAHLLHVLPRSPSYKGRFLIKSVERTYEFDVLQLASIELFEDPKRRTIVVVPGYMSDSETEWLHQLKNCWLKFEDVNVITVDWSLGNKGPYRKVVANYRVVSRQITMLLYYLAQAAGKDFESLKFRNNLYFVGHSLGAHISGWVGHEMRGQVARITGLDPAGPTFGNVLEYNRLNPTNAKLVDAIHSNAGVISRTKYLLSALGAIEEGLLMGIYYWIKDLFTFKKASLAESIASYRRNDREIFFGINCTVGHLDFYANGGSIQPGCEDKFRICDHHRAVCIYINAVEHENKARQSIETSEGRLLPPDFYRLFTFPARNYDELQTGQYFVRTCPEIITLVGGDYSRWLKRCAVPMDFVSRVDALKTELSKSYGIKFRKTFGKWMSTERPYFFETTASPPYVGQQTLLKVHVSRGKESAHGVCRWERGCHLRVTIMSDERRKSVSYLDLSPESIEMIDMDDFHGFVIPFANRVNWFQEQQPRERLNSSENSFLQVPGYEELSLAREASEPSEISETLDSDTESIQTLTSNSTQIFDTISLVHPPKQIYFGVAKEVPKFGRLIGIMTELVVGSCLDKCLLDVSGITVQPLIAADPFNGLYCRSPPAERRGELSITSTHHSIKLGSRNRSGSFELEKIVLPKAGAQQTGLDATQAA